MPHTVSFTAAAILFSAATLSAATVEVRVVDADGQPLPCRIHCKDAAGKAQRAEGLPFWHDHFVCAGSAKLQLAPGKYTYEIERGPEYRPAGGTLEITTDEVQKVGASLTRIADMAARGWWSGEVHVHRAVEEMPLHLRAEDLHLAPTITWWNARDQWRGREAPASTLVKVDTDRYYDVMAGEDEREGGAILYFGLPKPLPLPGNMQAFPEHPSPMKFVELARARKGVWLDVEKPFWWDMPVWLASGNIDSLGLANNHMCRSSMYENEAWGKPRDATRLPAPLGNGFWTQEVYYHVQNCGLRVPPSAGSASGVLPNPVGYNRAYVYLGKAFTYDAWWQGLKQGRSFVTNGPMLLCRANDRLPGHVFQSEAGLTIPVNLEVISKDPVPAIEVVQDGRVVQTIPLDRGTSPTTAKATASVKFERSGWFLVRAITENTKTFRFASTAPYYVEIGQDKTRVSRRSARFFLDWLDERAGRVGQKLDDPLKLREVLTYHDQAKSFWHDVLNRANAD